VLAALLLAGGAWTEHGMAQDKKGKPSITDSLEIEGVRLSNTAGTLRLQQIEAGSVKLSADGRLTLMTDMKAELHSRETTGTTVLTLAPKATAVIAGNSYDPVEGEVLPAPSFDELKSIASIPMSERFKGDFVLERDNSPEPVRLDFHGKGFIETETLIWSEKQQRLLTATPFRQSGKQDDASEILVTGSCFSVDRDFREWVYYAVDGSPVVFEFSGGTTPTEKGGS
jgi:hypothetical protein